MERDIENLSKPSQIQITKNAMGILSIIAKMKQSNINIFLQSVNIDKWYHKYIQEHGLLS